MEDSQEWAAPNQTEQFQAAAGTKPFKNIFLSIILPISSQILIYSAAPTKAETSREVSNVTAATDRGGAGLAVNPAFLYRLWAQYRQLANGSLYLLLFKSTQCPENGNSAL